MFPAFTASGVLPPFIGNGPAQPVLRSPYRTTMDAIVERFATSPARRAILNGLLEYRRDLTAAGFVDGFQWIDGSFVEDTEGLRGCAPADVDVVTILRRPPDTKDDVVWAAFVRANLSLFDPSQTKGRYKVDGYAIDLDKRPELIVADTTYWFGLFSHQRATAVWKGMLHVALGTDDTTAVELLDAAHHA